MGELPEFHAEVSVRRAGYAWETVGSDRQGKLVYADKDADGTSAVPENLFRNYNLFEEASALFRIFAELGPLDAFTAEDKQSRQRSRAEFGRAVIAFANKYGVPQADDSGGFLPEVPSARAIGWLIAEMQLALALWDAIKVKDKKAIAAIAQPDKELGWRVTFMGYEFTPVSRATRAFMRELRPEWDVHSRRGDEFALALQILEFLIARRNDAQLEFVELRRGLLAIRTRTKSLLSAMWLQLAMAIVENKEYRRCELCEKPFELKQRCGGRQGREDKRFCTDSCRVTAYQRRKVLAKKMRSDGANLRDIVRAVESDLSTVKKWLKE